MAALPSHPFGASLGLAAGLTAVLVHGAGAGSELGSCSVHSHQHRGCFLLSQSVFWASWRATGSTWLDLQQPDTMDPLPWAWHQQPLHLLGLVSRKERGFPVQRISPELVSCGEHRASPAADSRARVVPLAVEMSGKPLQAGRQAVSLLRAGASHGCAVCAALAHSCASSGLGSGLTMVLSHAGEGQHSTAVGSSSLGAPFPSASVIFTALCYDNVCFFPSFLLSLFLSLSFSLSVSLIFFCFLRIIFGQRQWAKT